MATTGIIGLNGALLRGQSMAPPARGSKLWHERYILHFANISHWTSPPDLPLTPPELRAIADRIVRYQQVGVRGL